MITPPKINEASRFQESGCPVEDLGDVAGQRVGLTRDELMDSVRTFAGSSRCAAVVLTEVNPDHVPDAESLPHFAERFAGRSRRRTLEDHIGSRDVHTVVLGNFDATPDSAGLGHHPITASR